MIKLYDSVSKQEREDTHFWRDMYEKECEKYNPFQFNLDIPDLAVGNDYQRFVHGIYTGIIIGLYSMFDPNIRKFLWNVKDVNEREW